MRTRVHWNAAIFAMVSGIAMAANAVIADAARRVPGEPARVAWPINDAKVAAAEDSSVDKAVRQKESMERPPAIAAPPVNGAKGRESGRQATERRGDARAKSERSKSRSRSENGRGQGRKERPQ